MALHPPDPVRDREVFVLKRRTAGSRCRKMGNDGDMWRLTAGHKVQRVV